MLIRLTRLTNDRHRFEILRNDGTHESHELETRSTLLHDLAHYAVETEAVVALLQGTFKDGDSPKTDAEQCARDIIAGFRSVARQPRDWVTPDFVTRARERLRRVQGQWRATPFHQTMELEFPLRHGKDTK